MVGERASKACWVLRWFMQGAGQSRTLPMASSSLRLAVARQAGPSNTSLVRRCFSSKPNRHPEDLRQYLAGWVGVTPGHIGVVRPGGPGVALSTAGHVQEEDSVDPGGMAVTIAGRSYLVPTLRVPLDASPQDLSQGVQSTTSLTAGYFKSAPIVLDLVEWVGSTSMDDRVLIKLLQELKASGLHAVGVTNAKTEQLQAAAQAAGVPCFLGRQGPAAHPNSSSTSGKKSPAHSPDASKPVSKNSLNEGDQGRLPPKVVHGNVRTGQQVIAERCSLVVMGSVNSGAEVASDGDIHIYGTLRGRALSGLSGDVRSQIFAAKFNAELCAVADVFTTCDQPADLVGLKPNAPTTVWLDPTSRELRFRSL